MTSKEAAKSLIWYLAKCGFKIVREPQAGEWINEPLRNWTASTNEPQEAWQSIETAPRDGSKILATGGGLGSEVEIVNYNERVGAWDTAAYTLDDRDDEPDGYSRPTHWQPRPTPPVTRPHQRPQEG
jgi:hypothetical protein